MQKFMLSFILIATLSANFNDRKGEAFETSIGIVHRAKNELVLTTNDGEIHTVKKGGQLYFRAGSSLGSFTLKDRFLISHTMSREELVQALASYME
jgi:hypothetical protein